MMNVTGADSLDRIFDPNCGTRTVRGGLFSLPKLGAVKLAVFIIYGHLFVLIASFYLAGRIVPGSLSNRPNNSLVISLEPQFTFHNFERCVVRLIDFIRVGSRLSLLDY